MKINNIYSLRVNPYERQMNIGKAVKAEKKADRVEISQAAKELQEAAKLIAERQEKVERLKQQVQTGTYKIDERAVAESVLRYYFNK
ncbi:flagellar biosynthesis anti-sigma factor FlgM [Thermolongibacillus altinsuensis]